MIQETTYKFNYAYQWNEIIIQGITQTGFDSVCLLRTIKGLRLYPLFQGNKLAHRSFVGAGRRHNTPSTEEKDVVTISTSSSHSVTVSLWFPKPQFPRGDAKWHYLHLQQVALEETNPDLRDPEGFIVMDCKRLFSRGRHYRPRLLTIWTLWKRWSSTGAVRTSACRRVETCETHGGNLPTVFSDYLKTWRIIS